MNADPGTSPIFQLCDGYLSQWAALDPVAAGMRGLSGSFGAVTDYSPDGHAARVELISRTLVALSAIPLSGDADRLAAVFLRERLQAQADWHAAGEPLRELRTPIGRVSATRDSVDLLPRGDAAAWRNIASRLAAIPVMFATWQASLNEGLRRGRYYGWPGQAPSYKLGERAWLAARADAARRPGFDLKRWHTAALSLGPLGLDSLATELARV